MEVLKSIFLGIVQGLTEFLPVSSSGHLIIFQNLGFGEVSLFTNVMLHLGTLVAVLIVYRKQIWQLISHPIESDLRYYIVAMIPTGIMAIIAKIFFPDALIGAYLPLGFMLTAVALTLSECLSRRGKLAYPKQPKIGKDGTLTYKNTALAGVFQGIALLPGASRSGLTMSAMLLSGVDREKAVEFSFLLSVPIILLSVVFELATFDFGAATINVGGMTAGIIAAFVSGLFAIKFMLKLVRKKSLIPFAVYTCLLSITLLILGFVL